MTNRMLCQTLDAPDHLHGLKPLIIHRDIKPANILYGGKGETFFLMDFGIAKDLDTKRTMVGMEWYCTWHLKFGRAVSTRQR